MEGSFFLCKAIVMEDNDNAAAVRSRKSRENDSEEKREARRAREAAAQETFNKLTSQIELKTMLKYWKQYSFDEAGDKYFRFQSKLLRERIAFVKDKKNLKSIAGMAKEIGNFTSLYLQLILPL